MRNKGELYDQLGLGDESLSEDKLVDAMMARYAEGLKTLLNERGVLPTDYDDWRKIEETEVGQARPGSPREKFVRVEDWLSALGR